jgi:putative transcriptional regulator
MIDSLVPTNPRILVSMPKLQDPNFNRAVLLLLEHTSAGALAFVLNRPTPVGLRQMISLDIEIPESIPAWYGGPVDTATAIVLHNQTRQYGDTEVATGIYLSSSEQTLSDMVMREDFQKLHPYRFLVGYAGWGAGQLDGEISNGAWLSLPLDQSLLFETPWDQMWSKAFATTSFVNQITRSPSQYLN